MIPRILEPEVMDSPLEATDYNTMDHSQVNRVFVDDLLCALSRVTNLPARGPCTILDVGTGTAQIPIELCGRPGHWHVTAADLAQSMLDVAAENIAAARLGEWIKLQHLDAKRLPFENGQFDVVMSNSIIHHIPAPEECLAEMVRVVTPGGLLFVTRLAPSGKRGGARPSRGTVCGRRQPPPKADVRRVAPRRVDSGRGAGHGGPLWYLARVRAAELGSALDACLQPVRGFKAKAASVDRMRSPS